MMQNRPGCRNQNFSSIDPNEEQRFTPNKKYIQHGDEGYGLIGKPEEAMKLPE
jgi:hypothetical protein